jgi:hypothetical protein
MRALLRSIRLLAATAATAATLVAGLGAATAVSASAAAPAQGACASLATGGIDDGPVLYHAGEEAVGAAPCASPMSVATARSEAAVAGAGLLAFGATTLVYRRRRRLARSSPA